MIPKETRGLPENVNPFCIIRELEPEDDGSITRMAGEYFDCTDRWTKMSCSGKVSVPPYSQEEMEELVELLVREGEVYFIAVKIEYAHIIPKDLCDKVYVARVYDEETGECKLTDCFYRDKDGNTIEDNRWKPDLKFIEFIRRDLLKDYDKDSNGVKVGNRIGEIYSLQDLISGMINGTPAGRAIYSALSVNPENQSRYQAYLLQQKS